MPHLNGYARDGGAGSLPGGEAAGAVNRRTAVLFRKSKVGGPHRTPREDDRAADGGAEGGGEGEQGDEGQLGSKSFLSVVIPRLETLLHKRKRKHNGGGRDSEGELGEEEEGEEDEAPVKRLNTGEGPRPSVRPSVRPSALARVLILVSLSPLRLVQRVPGGGRGERAAAESQQSRPGRGAAETLRLRVLHLLQQQPAGEHQVPGSI